MVSYGRGARPALLGDDFLIDVEMEEQVPAFVDDNTIMDVENILQFRCSLCTAGAAQSLSSLDDLSASVSDREGESSLHQGFE